MNFTKSQQKVIDLRKRNILVSAAAGSGKTAVLVERIIRLITDSEDPVDIDRLLIVTFTNAAAAEMRERIGRAIEKKLQKEPENGNLLRQATLLHHAQITTIDSFCLFLVKNHFHEIGLDPGFRVADPGEIQLIKQDSLKEIMEEMLEREETAEEFQHLMETLAYGGKEKVLEDIILRLHNFCESFPWPEEWLENRYEDYKTDKGIENTDWGKEAEYIFRERLSQISYTLSLAIKYCMAKGGPYMYLEALQADEELVGTLEKAGWKDSFQQIENMSFQRISAKKDPTVKEEMRELVKNMRDQIKTDLGKLREDLFPYSWEIMKQQMAEIFQVEKTLIQTVLEFRKRFLMKKREKNLLDFSDMEHLALEILVTRQPERDQGGVPGFCATRTALEYQKHYREIMIDEYQDSNLVQELLLQSIAGENHNRFMVGDLKQSIYKFRLARPEIFLEKYHTYTKEASHGNQRIDLHQNFRSREEVIHSVNDVFYQIMGEQLGKVDYTQREALFVGAQYPQTEEDYRTTLLLLEEGKEDKKEAEARMVAGKIRKMVGSFLVTDKETGEIRPLRYSDIVVLLRTNAGWDDVFYRVFMEQGIPTAITNKTGYFNAIEVQTLLGFLQALDNPLQDIPLYGVLRSSFGSFLEEEIVALKAGKAKSLYENLKIAANNLGRQQQKEGSKEKHEPQSLSAKAAGFLEHFNGYRNQVYLLPIHKLLRQYLQDTGYLYYCLALPGGEQRAANIKMLLEKAESYEKTSYFGLFHFIRYMEQLQKYEIETPEAGITDEGADVVRIMSIHKSKGLEFPVCFLCGLSKKINQRDSSEGLVCHMDLGIGIDYRDSVRRIRKKDIRRNVLADKIRRENLGEELRILYVAMTRAKEKLIMTAVVKDYEKQMMELLHLKEQKEEKLPLSILSHANSYLDLILAAAVRKPQHLEISLENPFTDTKELERQAVDHLLERTQMEYRMEVLEKAKEQEERQQQLKESFHFCYSHENLRGLYVKTTVSELKMKAMEEKDEETFRLFEEPSSQAYIPTFVKEREEEGGIRRGNAYHRVMELMKFTPLPDVEQLLSQMECLQREEILEANYLCLLQKRKLKAFLESELAKRMEKADRQGLLFRERPFVLGIPANLLDKKFPTTERVLIQGIIDAYFEEEGELVVLDYKTDAVRNAQELRRRYEQQLKYYEQALQQLTGKRVKERLLYSFALDQVILV